MDNIQRSPCLGSGRNCSQPHITLHAQTPLTTDSDISLAGREIWMIRMLYGMTHSPALGTGYWATGELLYGVADMDAMGLSPRHQ